MMQQAKLVAIGFIETPYRTLAECPRNIDPKGPVCRLVVKESLRDGLSGLHAGQRIVILYWFEQVDRSTLRQPSRVTGETLGIFALRTPNRCNPIGMAILPIEEIGDNVVTVRGLDCLNGTPLIDIKPAISSE
ncbi:MAG: SAM-dependent methyltransferase [Desulfuromonadales bacterium]